MRSLFSQYNSLDEEVQKELIKAFECLLQAVNYYNLQINLNQITGDLSDNEMVRYTVQNIFLRQLREDIALLPLYNEFRLGRYYNTLLDGFRDKVVHSLSNLISYFSSLKYLE